MSESAELYFFGNYAKRAATGGFVPRFGGDNEDKAGQWVFEVSWDWALA